LPNLAQSRLNKLTSLFYNLIWNNKPDRVKRNTLIGDITQGGLNMIHIHSFNIYLKLSMIKILLTNPEGKISDDKMSLTEKSVCGFASLRQSKTSLQKLTEISLSFFFCRQSRLNKLTSLFYNLIWNNKPDRVKRNTLIGDITQGGLNMIHIHSYLKGFLLSNL
jgi:predicted SnoaL-like aldol condensation-catalyzing enzyme